MFGRDAPDVPVQIDCEQGSRLELEVLSQRPRKREFRKKYSTSDECRQRLVPTVTLRQAGRS